MTEEVESLLATAASTSEPRHTPYDRAPTTRLLCIISLFFSILVGCAFIALGAVAEGSFHPIEIPHVGPEVLSLAINIVIIACTEPLGLIHSTSLRWALFRDKKLEFNTNLRLLTFSKTSKPNGVVANIVYLFALALCYAASPVVLVAQVDYDQEKKYYCTSNVGPICLGVSILVQCGICGWCLLDSTPPPTWNASPLITLAVALDMGVERSKSRCLMSVNDRNEDDVAQKPSTVQVSAYQAHPHVLGVLIGASLVMGFLCVWAGVVIWNGYATGSGTNWSFFPAVPFFEDVGNQAPGSYLYFFNVKEADSLSEPELLAALLFTLVIQSFLTVSTHCAELQVILSRDETIWRSIDSDKGSNPNLSTWLAAVGNWQSVLLLCFKPLLHWMYGLAMFIDYSGGVVMFAPQIVYLSILWVFFLAFVWVVSTRHPRGYLPATYGHVQTMLNIADEWHPRMFWGDKGKSTGTEIRHAGTAAKRLDRVHEDALYKGASDEEQVI